MDLLTLAQSVGLPIAMLLVALVTVLKYFIEGKVVARWVYDEHMKERDGIITRQAIELQEWKTLALKGARATALGADTLQAVVGRN